MLRIKAWSLLLKRANGGRVSSHYLSRTLTKANLSHEEIKMGAQYTEEQLKNAYTDYYLAKGSAKATRESYLLTLAEAYADKNNLEKASVYKYLVQRERQRKGGRRIKFLRG